MEKSERIRQLERELDKHPAPEPLHLEHHGGVPEGVVLLVGDVAVTAAGVVASSAE